MKNGKIFLLALGVLILAVAAIGVLVFLNSRPSQTARPPNTARPRSTIVAGSANNQANRTPDPLNDSGSDSLPNPPVNQGGGTEPPAQDPLDDSASGTNNPNVPPLATPPASGGMVSLPGTAWTQQQSKENYEFCADKKWKISDAADTVTGTGTFEQQGASLVLSGDGNPKTYQLTWDAAASVLTLKEGDTTLNLAYNGESACP